jgi:hypothetical protein
VGQAFGERSGLVRGCDEGANVAIYGSGSTPETKSRTWRSGRR